MTTPSLDSQIDALYALPLEAFTAARNALAKSLKGDAASVSLVKSLAKPTQIPWAVNLLYWNDRSTWTRLLDAGLALRTAQLAALEGRPSDARVAESAHRSAITEAAASAARLAAQAGGAAASDPLTRMLEALSLASAPPSPPGRYTDVLQPAGFEALAGLSRGVPATAAGRAPSAPSTEQLDAAYRLAVATRERRADALARAEASAALADSQVVALRAQLERAEATRASARAAAADAARELALAETAERDAEPRLRNV